MPYLSWPFLDYLHLCQCQSGLILKFLLTVHSDPIPAPKGGKGPVTDQKRLVMLNPTMRGSSVKTLAVKPVSSELVKKSVIGASSNTFFT